MTLRFSGAFPTTVLLRFSGELLRGATRFQCIVTIMLRRSGFDRLQRFPMLLLQPGMARAMLLLQPGMARAGRAWLGRAGAGRASLEPEIIDDTGRLPKTPRIITQSRPKTDLYKTTPKTILTSLPDPHHPQCRHHVR